MAEIKFSLKRFNWVLVLVTGCQELATGRWVLDKTKANILSQSTTTQNQVPGTKKQVPSTKHPSTKKLLPLRHSIQGDF